MRLRAPEDSNLELPFAAPEARLQLSKSRFVAGSQCHRLLWWQVHEPLAVELQPDKVLQDRFDQGAQVGALARMRFPGGVLIQHSDKDERVELTRQAMEAGAPAIFEASFVADDTFVAADVLVREGDGWRLIEVKSATSIKEEHIPEVALQLHVLTRSGVGVTAAEVMHLSSEFRNPDQGDLFARGEITADVLPMLPGVPTEIAAQLAMLAGPLPDAPIGRRCHEPRACPFLERCWPKDPDHISKLYNVGPANCQKYMDAGVHRIGDIPPTKKLPAAAQRQIRSMKENRIIVEPGLAEALKPFAVKLGFLDFETIQRAVPVWPGMSPWEQAAAQFSYHEANGDGTYRHEEFLAEGPQDARPILAERMIAATRGAERVVSYSAFEKTRIRGLQIAVPDLCAELVELENKLIDLLPVIRENVYHPGFEGSFSLKKVLPAMVPGLTYNDLVIVDGMVASVEIARLLFVADRISTEERSRVRQDLLNYCERDTHAMVELLARLRALGFESAAQYAPLDLA
jgi:predicted RecB family nuclease